MTFVPAPPSVPSHRRPRRGAGRGETGTTAAEYLGVLVVVAALVAALGLTPIGRQVSGGLRQAICSIVDGGDCAGSTEAGGAAGSGQPGADTSGGEGSGSDCSGLWCTVTGVAGAAWSGTTGVAGAAWDDVTGIWDLATDPGSIVDAGKAGKVGELARLADETAGLAADARRAADAASDAAKAGDTAKATSAASQARQLADEAAERAAKIGCPISAPRGRVGGAGGRGLLAMAAPAAPIRAAGPCDDAADAARQADKAADAAEAAAAGTGGSVLRFESKAAAREGLPGDLAGAGNRFFRGATSKSRDFQAIELPDGGYRLQFFSPANNPGYGKLYVQEIDRTGQVLREYKDTMGPDGLIETKWVHGGP